MIPYKISKSFTFSPRPTTKSASGTLTLDWPHGTETTWFESFTHASITKGCLVQLRNLTNERDFLSEKLTDKIMSYLPLDNTTESGNLGDLKPSVIQANLQERLPYSKLYSFIDGERANFRGNDVKKASATLELLYGTRNRVEGAQTGNRAPDEVTSVRNDGRLFSLLKCP